MNDQKDIRRISVKELESFFVSINEKPFRAKQVWEWIWKKQSISFDEMTNLSVELRKKLQEEFAFYVIEKNNEAKSKDGTVKTAFRLHDGHLIEGVMIPSENRVTACISTQVGCTLACKFCATGKQSFVRNLEYTEIIDQVIYINRQSNELHQRNLSNIVVMGMGEPLLNYENLLKAIERITASDGFGMSPSRITVSTVGLEKMIRKLGDDQVKFNLALSLHAANDRKRSEIMPVNDSNSLEKLASALKHYYSCTTNRITLEYLIFDRFNDSLEDARELAEYCKNFPVKINVIEYNKVEGTGLRKASPEKVKAFITFLETKNLIINLRKSRGEDVNAACGQLAGKNK